jgi:hypothetical protein
MIDFTTFTDNIDENLRVGSEFPFNLNSVGITRYKGEDEIIYLDYFEII